MHSYAYIYIYIYIYIRDHGRACARPDAPGQGRRGPSTDYTHMIVAIMIIIMIIMLAIHLLIMILVLVLVLGDAAIGDLPLLLPIMQYCEHKLVPSKLLAFACQHTEQDLNMGINRDSNPGHSGEGRVS